MMGLPMFYRRPPRALGELPTELAGFESKRSATIRCIEKITGRTAKELSASSSEWQGFLELATNAHSPPTAAEVNAARALIEHLAAAPVRLQLAGLATLGECFADLFGLPSVVVSSLGASAEANVGGCAACSNYGWTHRMRPVRVGALVHHPACAAVGRARARVGGCETASGADLVGLLSDAVRLLDRDVQLDACGDAYGPACKGTSPAVDALEIRLGNAEAKGEKLDAGRVLTLAGVTPSAANIASFAACVKKREDATAAVPRGTLAYCALAVRDATTPSAPLLPRAHTSSAWRDRWETFRNTFARFADKYATEEASLTGSPPSDASVGKQLALYSQFRSQFLSAGGETEAPCLDEPWPWTTKLAVATSVGFALYLVVQFFARRGV
jgi:hypothetical protein